MDIKRSVMKTVGNIINSSVHKIYNEERVVDPELKFRHNLINNEVHLTPVTAGVIEAIKNIDIR